MSSMEARLKVHPFFMMDENFLLYRKRAMHLLERMQRAGKSWDLYVCSSTNPIRKNATEELVSPGVRFELNGPSLFRICRATLEGWKRYKDHPDRRIRERFAREVGSLKTAYSGLLWAMERQLRETNASVSQQIHALRRDFAKEFGWMSRAAAKFVGPLALRASRREDKRLARRKTDEARVIIERGNSA